MIACEESGKVRDAFTRAGHFAVSVDLMPSRTEGNHIEGSILDLDLREWGLDLLIAHPPCTYLANSGVRWLYRRDEDGERVRYEPRWEQLDEAADFFRAMVYAEVPRVAVENPRMHRHAFDRVGLRQTQTIHPWQFGHGESKATGLWLRNLPELVPTDIVEGREQRMWKMGPSAERQKLRSETYDGIAQAMADQWGPLL
jgi:hypothetical protein